MDEPEEELGKDGVAIQLVKLVLDMSYDRQIALLKHLGEIPVATLEASDRDEARKRYASAVTFSAEGKTHRGTSQDISTGGMFIRTDDAFTVGHVITLTIPFSNNQRSVRVPAEIVRVEEDGIGVKFLKKAGEPDMREWSWPDGAGP